MTVNSLGETEITNWEYRYFLKVVDEVGLDAGTSRTLPSNLKSPERLVPPITRVVQNLAGG